MTLMTLEPRTTGSMVEPFSLMRNLLRWEPFTLPEPRAYTPAFDIRETPEGYRFLADLPGVKREDLDINLTGNRLTISGKRESEARNEQESCFMLERSTGSFARTFSLPEGIDGQGVRADLKDGVLTVVVPKVPEVQPRKIEIQTT